MVEQVISLNGIPLKVHSLNTLVVGSGAAAFRAAETLFDLGQRDIVILTEGVCMGTSRNTGSDKQTYYKLTLAGDAPDSVEEMARTLFDGGAMHGDIALVQAALSARCFLHLAEIGVPFPQNRYGEYSGYRTDHDARLRATSAGPLTSRFMTEKLEEQIRQRGIHIFDHHLAVGILTAGTEEGVSTNGQTVEKGGLHQDDEASVSVPSAEVGTIGLIALDMAHLETPAHGVTLINCTNIIYATGGPAGMYQHSVYPESQTGATGIALEAGVRAVNLTESQYGIASVKFRWNLSGTYQQVLPRYLSTDANGGDAREFLMDWYKTPGDMLDAVFLKGYQWPFDPEKTAPGGSSVVDLLVGMEAAKGRRVYLDFMENPETGRHDGTFDFTLLGEEAHSYLERSGALFGRPIDRLRLMNEPAIALFRSHGIDLETEWLEISVCAQHNNGGLYHNSWWESNLRHFFPVGEVAGSFGIHRPGGSALNATQVGALRAAEYIAAKYRESPIPVDEFIRLSSIRISGILKLTESLFFLMDRCGGGSDCEGADSQVSVETLRHMAGSRMSAVGAHLRPIADLSDAIVEAKSWILQFPANIRLDSVYGLPDAFRLRDILLTRYAYLSAIQAYTTAGGGSRGSSLLVEEENVEDGVQDGVEDCVEDGLECGVDARLPGSMKTRPDNPEFQHLIGELTLQTMISENGQILEAVCHSGWTKVRPVPERQDWFETVWREYREGKQFEGER